MLYVNLNIKLKLRKKKRYPPTGQHNILSSHTNNNNKKYLKMKNKTLVNKNFLLNYLFLLFDFYFVAFL